MKEETYRYLFPFEKVKPNSKILIYGAGIVGMEYLKQILLTNYCDVVGMADKNYKNYSAITVPVYSPECIHRLELDYVVIAQRVFTHLSEIKSILLEQGVSNEKIIYISERTEMPSIICEQADGAFLSPAYEKSEVSVAILAAGGIGDMVIQKRLIVELIHFVSECAIDIFYVQNGDFLEYLYENCENINAIVPDLGVRYHTNRSNYTIGIELLSTRYVHVDVLKDKQIPFKYHEFQKRMLILQEESKKENLTSSTLVYAIYQRRLYKGLNAYTAFNYNGAFEIKNKQVDIPLNYEGKKRFQSFKLKKYVTLNFGNGVCKDGSKISKMWSQKNFEQLIASFKKKYPEIEVIQLGGDEGQKLNGVDNYFLGETFGVVAHILKNSLLHIDIEGGLVHIASQLGTKCVVLFGPTSKNYLAYDNNINLSVGKCQNCFGLYDDIYKCARNMEEPECMFSITPETVMAYIETYMEQISH